LTTDPETKLAPFTVSVKVASPTIFEVGDMLVVAGTRLLTVKVCAFDVPPPGVALRTVIEKVPAEVTSEAGIDAVSWVVLTKVVVRFDPLKRTVDPETKLVPLTVSVKIASPAFLDVGEILVVAGTGLLTVNTCALEVPPPGVGFVTVMLKVPAEVRSEV